MYLKAGTRIVWGINPITQEVEVYHQGQSTPAIVLKINDELDGEDVVTGFKIEVAKLFG